VRVRRSTAGQKRGHALDHPRRDGEDGGDRDLHRDADDQDRPVVRQEGPDIDAPTEAFCELDGHEGQALDQGKEREPPPERTDRFGDVEAQDKSR
jgi:hypothetical protein